MTDSRGLFAKKFVAECGGYTRAIDIIMSFVRALWSLAFEDNSQTRESSYRVISYDHLRALSIRSNYEKLYDILIEKLRVSRFCLNKEDDDNKQLKLHVSAFLPLLLVREFLSGIKPDQELRYSVTRNIQQHYKFFRTSRNVRLLYLMG
jgi:hypothetical protein